MTHGLSKRERVCSVKAVEALVSGGRYLSSGPVRCCYFVRKDDEPLNRIMVTVPKKFFKRAVKRNLLKRRMRESYRLQKEILTRNGIDLMFVYTSKEVADYNVIYGSVGTILGTVNKRCAE